MQVNATIMEPIMKMLLSIELICKEFGIKFIKNLDKNIIEKI